MLTHISAGTILTRIKFDLMSQNESYAISTYVRYIIILGNLTNLEIFVHKSTAQIARSDRSYFRMSLLLSNRNFLRFYDL